MFVNKVCTALSAGCTVVVKPAEQTPLTCLALAALLEEAGAPAGVVNVVTGFGPGAGTALTHHPDVAKISFTGSMEVKPTEQTPLTCLALAALLEEAGAPAGVVNVVTGFGPDAGTALTDHVDVAKISFTGSMEVGKQIQQAAGKANLKRVTLELGGKSPLVIMDDADLNLAVPWAAHGIFGSSGQLCFAASRTFVQSGIYNKFLKRAVEFAKNIKIGNPAEPGVDHGPQADIYAAVEAAKAAFHRNSEWRLMDASARGALLNKFADLVERDQQYLAQLESYNNGMVMNMAAMMPVYVARNTRYLASLADKIQGNTIPVDGDSFAYTLKQPVGVCGLILPWNVPILVFVNKVVTALTAGCTVVVKPAEQTPLTALALAALLKEAGLPAGVVNVVNVFNPGAGTALTHHPDVAKISFTGSVEVGKLIQQAAGKTNLKRVTLELGGKSPLVIMNDADLNTAVTLAGSSVFVHQGQICVAASRLFVQSGIYDKFVEKAVEFAKNRKISEEMMDKVLGYIKKGKQEGANILTGGNRIGNTGSYIEPTVFVNVKDDMTIAIEEIFGPVQSIFKFETLEEVIDRANNTNYGLKAGIVTSNINNALQFAKHVEAGNVGINSYMGTVQAPFGGFKDSGVGRENGMKCVEACLEEKTVSISLPKKF